MEQIVVTNVDSSGIKLRSRERASSITKAEQNVEKLGVDTVDITVESSQKINFYIGAKISIFGRDYTLNIPAKERKTSECHFVYDLQFEGVQYDLLRCQYNVNVDTTGNIIQDLNGSSLTGDIKMFLDVLVANANRIFPGKWSVGIYPANTETKTLVFGDSDTCLSVLQSLCSSSNYNTNFRIDIDVNGNRTINIGQTGSVFGHTFEYGKGKGLYELTREKVSQSNIINRLFVYGGSKNIVTAKYRADKLCLPDRCKSQSYIEDAASIAKYGVWEGTQPFEDVYPHRTGTVTALGSSVYSFVDSSMDFDINERDTNGATKYLLSGQSAKIKFTKGKLAGFEFECKYDHTIKTFTVVKQTDENDYTFPSETLSAFQIAVGDEYVLVDIYQPQTYIDSAEQELLTKGASKLSVTSKPQIQYGLSIDKMFLEEYTNGVGSNIFWVGDFIPVKDNDLDINKTIDIVGFTRNLLDEFDYKLTISDIPVEVNTIVRTITDVKEITNIIRLNNIADPARIRRNYKATSEIVTMLETVKAEAVLIGNDPAAQFELSGAVITSNAVGDANALTVTESVIIHNYYPVGNPGTWTVSSFNASSLTPSSAYRLYVKASKTAATAIYYLSATKVGVEDIAGYYMFPVGILSSVFEGARVFQTIKGYTLITGDCIKTGTFVNKLGQTVLNLDNRTFYGSFTFSNGDNAQTKITEAAAAAAAAQSSANTANNYINSVLPNTISGLQNQIDGVVDSWYYAYSPSLSNYPATDWTTDAIKDRHIGDTFTNTQTFVDNTTTPDAGKSWRFVKNSGVYSWTPIADSDAVKALINAAKAQDTADGKRRTFTSQPTNADAYDVGDLWAKATYGSIYSNDMLSCKTAKAAGVAFDIAHWEKASKYTDDTAVNNLEIGGRNLLKNTANFINYDNWLNNRCNVLIVEVNMPSEKFTGKVLEITNTDSNGVIWQYRDITTSNREYTVSMLAYCYNVVRIYIEEFNQNNEEIGHISTDYSLTVGVFNKLCKSFTINENATKIAVNIYCYGATGSKLWLSNVKLETGSKATDWTPAPEDVDAKITALDYLKTALQGSTDISGGLLATNVLLMKTLAGVITGGMSGLADDNTGFWTGGTYADAINAVANIILRKDGSGQLAGGKILWDLFGALSVGNFKIEGGAIVGYDSSLRERVKLHNGSLNTLSELTNSWARQSALWKWFNVRTTQYVNETSSSQTITRVFTTFDSVSLPYANMQLRLSKGAHSITSTGGTVESSSYLFKIYNSSNQLVTTDAGNLGTIQLANAGTYSITLEVTVSVVVPAGASEYTKINTTTNGYCDVYQSVARTEISSDGFMSYWTNALYLYFSQSAGLTYKGSMNIPGVLAAASVASGGGSTNAWGAKVGSSSWQNTGTYTINHSIGHNNYTVQITPRAASRIGYVSGTPSSSSFTVVMTNMSGTPVDAAFDYEVIGSN